MPNWCNTSYRFEGDKKEIADIYKKLNSIERRFPIETPIDLGRKYIGNVITTFGGIDIGFDCQGTLDSIERVNDTTLHIVTTTGWSERNEIWDFVLTKYPSVKYYYYAQEPSACRYITNDVEGKYFPERYVIEKYDQDTVYYKTEAETLQEFSKLIHCKIASWCALQKAVKRWNAFTPDEYVHVYEIQIKHENKAIKQRKYLPNVVAAFLTHSRVLRIYRNKSCILNVVVDGELGDDSDFWNTIYIDDKVLDINLYEVVGYDEPTLAAYPIENDQVDWTTWEYIKLKMIPL